MSEKDSLKGLTYTFEKKQKPKMNPFFFGVISGFLVFAGLAILIVVIFGSNNPVAKAFATETATPTITTTPTETLQPTIETTEAPTATNTPSGPQNYLVVENDTCWSISQAFGVQIDVLIAYNGDKCNNVIPGMTIVIPPSNAELPTATPFPTDFARGTEFQYTVQLGDTLVSIADKFDDDYTQLMARNGITDANSIQAGDVLKVRYNIMTRTPTLAPTSTTFGNFVTPLPSSTPTP